MAVPVRLHLLGRRRGARGPLSAQQDQGAEELGPEGYRGTTLLRATLLCRCPRCGHGSVFKGVLAINFRCRACGLDLTRHDIGDGPALALVIFWSVAVLALAIAVEYAAAPSYWLHIILWPLLLMALILATVRPLKAGLIAIGYFYRMGKIRL